MADWVKCTNTDGKNVYVNFSIARSVYWEDSEGCSIVAYPGSDDDDLWVRERPETILAAREPHAWED